MHRPVTHHSLPVSPALEQSTLPRLAPETAPTLTLEELVRLAEQTQRTLSFMTAGGKLRVPEGVDAETPWALEAETQDAFRSGVCYTLVEPLRIGLNYLIPEARTPQIEGAVAQARDAFEEMFQNLYIWDEELSGRFLESAPKVIEKLLTGLQPHSSSSSLCTTSRKGGSRDAGV